MGPLGESIQGNPPPDILREQMDQEEPKLIEKENDQGE